MCRKQQLISNHRFDMLSFVSIFARAQMCEHIRNKTRNVSPILEIENVGNFLLAQVRYSVLMHSVGCFPALFCLLVSYDHLSKEPRK